ncbi:MAG: helix-turn-helix transcriptional regulator [Clostridia bacterium]|nr:helix-turn-helix transcriptional regulator [Clostridia bacterium]
MLSFNYLTPHDISHADLLNINSVTYLHYEKDQREPPLSLLADMAKLYDVSVDYILGLNDY